MGGERILEAARQNLEKEKKLREQISIVGASAGGQGLLQPEEASILGGQADDVARPAEKPSKA